jgi:hypothetical protein
MVEISGYCILHNLLGMQQHSPARMVRPFLLVKAAMGVVHRYQVHKSFVVLKQMP